MTPTLKKKLLERINAGMDADSACAELNIPVVELAKASPKFSEQITIAQRAGSARLRGRLFKNALAGDDTKYLQDILDKRASAGANQTITRIERVIIQGGHRCVHCGKPPATEPKAPKRTNGQAARD
jgi:hypothetical protein